MTIGKSHLGEDWGGQWKRVMRAYARVERYPGALPTVALDDVWGFFNNHGRERSAIKR